MSGQVELFPAPQRVPVRVPPASGFVPTPEAIVDLMVAKLFDGKPPSRASTVLDPGCGPGAFEAGIIRWCRRTRAEMPKIVGVESDPERYAEAAGKFRACDSITIVHEDFLVQSDCRFDYVIGNPPYVSITSLSQSEKAAFRRDFVTARGRFDLYLLFFEQGLKLLTPGGRLVFITPEKFLYVKTAESLRRLLGRLDVREILFAREEIFGDLVTYPTITTVDTATPSGRTRAVLRDGTTKTIRFPTDGSSLLPLLNDQPEPASTGLTLEDVCLRVSCGVATGADKVFVQRTESITDALSSFAYPTVSGRQLVPGQEHVRTKHSILVPYNQHGTLLPITGLGALGDYLSQPARRRRLTARTCARRKPWYAFHDSAPLPDILRPKLLCKDITVAPGFWFDSKGDARSAALGLLHRAERPVEARRSRHLPQQPRVPAVAGGPLPARHEGLPPDAERDLEEASRAGRVGSVHERAAAKEPEPQGGPPSIRRPRARALDP